MFKNLLPEVPAVTPAEATSLMDEGALMIDIREQSEWDQSRIPGTVLKPMSTINDWWQDLPRDQTIILQCRTGSRSAQATHALITQAGFDNVFNLTGGIVAWTREGLAVDS